MCQGYELNGVNKGKGLMSNPNTDLGEWILGDILKTEGRTLITKSMLDQIGIDSVEICKFSEDKFEIDFKESGSFEKFVEANL